MGAGDDFAGHGYDDADGSGGRTCQDASKTCVTFSAMKFVSFYFTYFWISRATAVESSGRT
jgi:hypothetical protein